MGRVKTPFRPVKQELCYTFLDGQNEFRRPFAQYFPYLRQLRCPLLPTHAAATERPAPMTLFTLSRPALCLCVLLLVAAARAVATTPPPADTLPPPMARASEVGWTAWLAQLSDWAQRQDARQRHVALAAHLEQVRARLPDTLPPHDPRLTDLYRNLGRAYAKISRYEVALPVYLLLEETLLRSAPPDTALLLYTYRSLGYLNGNMGHYPRYLHYQQRRLALARAAYGETDVRVAAAYNDIGLLYTHLKEYTVAREYLQKALVMTQALPAEGRPSPGPMINNLALTYFEQGDFEAARAQFERALALPDVDATDRFSMLGNLGKSLVELGAYDRARQCYQQAFDLKLAVFGPDRADTYAAHYLRLGQLEHRQGHLQAALAAFEQAVAYAPAGRRADDYHGMSKVYQDLGNLDQALRYVQRALALECPEVDSNRVEAPLSAMLSTPRPAEVLLPLLSLRARLLHQRYQRHGRPADLQAAYQTCLRAVAQIDSVRGRMIRAESASYLTGQATTLYEHTLQLAQLLHQQTGDARYLQAAFLVMEQNKSNLLLAALQASSVREGSPLPPALAHREEDLRVRQAYLRKQLHESAPHDTLLRQRLHHELFATSQAHDALRDTLRRDHAAYHQFRYGTAPDLATTRGHLRPAQLLLEYFVGDSTVYLLAIHRQGAQLYALAATDPLQAQINALRTQLAHRNAAAATTSYGLYNQLLATALRQVPADVDQLVVVPDGLIGLVPFDVLLERPARPGDDHRRLAYLIRRYETRYHYSARLLTPAAPAAPAAGSFLGWAPVVASAGGAERSQDGAPLPYARAEVEAIGGRLGGELRLGNDATEAAFKAQAADYRWLHVASHGVINDQDPLYSYLQFSADGNGNEDGRLYTYELYHLPLQADLVCLSACNSSVGNYTRGEGVMSLAKGFMFAGVRNVVASLWSVPDQASQLLMTRFYEELEQGTPKATALRRAKLAYLDAADPLTAAPYFWGSFVLVGPNEAQPHGLAAGGWMIALLLLAAAGGGYLLYRRKTARRPPLLSA